MILIWRKFAFAVRWSWIRQFALKKCVCYPGETKRKIWRIADGESCSPCSKRGVNVGIQEKSSNSTSVRQVSVRVYRRILPARPTATSENQKGKQIQEQHFLRKCRPGNEEVSSFLNRLKLFIGAPIFIFLCLGSLLLLFTVLLENLRALEKAR